MYDCTYDCVTTNTTADTLTYIINRQSFNPLKHRLCTGFTDIFHLKLIVLLIRVMYSHDKLGGVAHSTMIISQTINITKSRQKMNNFRFEMFH